MLNDKWGILRNHEENYGILRNTSFTHSEEYEFERLLKSSISLDAKLKIRVIVAIPKLSVKQIHELINVFKSEISEFNSYDLQEKSNIEALIKEKEYEWQKIEIYLEGYVSMHMNTDNNRNMTPSSIKGLMEKMVKGQGEAARSIATLLYYHNAVSTAYTLNHTLPFKTPAPIMIIGGTGTGKSFMLEVGCDIVGLPYMHVDCSSLVSTGIVGNTVDDILKNLLRKVNYNIKKAETSIVLFDEIDKLLSHHDGQSILHQLLRIIEGSIVPIDDHKSEERLKEIKNISTHQMLFIFAGSFQKVIDQKSKFLDDNNTVINISDIEETGLPKELLGRINKIVTLNSLTRENYKEILLNSRNSPLEQIKSMIKINQQDFLIDDVIIESILDQAENSPYGARSLKQIIWNHFESILYEAPNYQTPVDHKPECWVNAIIKFNHTNKTLSVKNSEKEAVATTPTATKLLNTLPNSIKQKVMNGQLIRVTAYVENGDLVKIKA